MYGIYEDGKVIAKFAAPLQILSNVPVFVSDTLSLKRFVTKRPAQRWEIETSIEPLSNDAQDLMVNLITRGSFGTVQVLFPQNYGTMLERNGQTSTPLATGTAGTTQVVLTNTMFNSFIPKGTFIKFLNHNKIYMTTADLNNAGTLNIYPELRTSVSSIAMYWGNNVIGTFYYDTDVMHGMQYIDGILMSIDTLKLVEAL